MGYYAAFLLLSCRYLPLHPPILGGDNLRIVFMMVTFPWAVSVPISRVLLGHHTWTQVAVGVSYGFLFALGWFNAWVF
jgi:dolichyldiphosphatase